MDYYRVEPFGEERADLRAGIIAAEVANGYRDLSKHPAAKPADYMLFNKANTDDQSSKSAKEPIKDKETWKRLKDKVKAFARATGTSRQKR